MSKLYIIPGYGETTRFKNYRRIIAFARENKIDVVPVHVKWSHNKTLAQYLREIESAIPENTQDDIVLGFSIGAYLALILSGKRIFRIHLFCTVSPFFKESFKKIPEETRKFFGTKLMKGFQEQKMPRGNIGQAYFFVGNKDWPLAIETNRKLNKKWKGKGKFVLVRGVEHELEHPKYLSAIRKILSNI